MYETSWAVDPVKVLTRRELATVLASLNGKAAKLPQARMNRTVLRLACFAGLRVSEIAGLTLNDVHVDSTRPHLRVRPEIAKGCHGRTVLLGWDEGTLDYLKELKRDRERHGGRPGDTFECCLYPNDTGHH
jgi:integrase